MKKLIAILLALLCILTAFSACSQKSGPETAEKPVVNIGFLKGPTGMGAAYLMNENDAGSTGAAYNCRLETAADVLQSALISGELDMAALPVNVVSVLNAKTEGKIQMLAVNTLGVLYLMSNSDEIESVADLKGKTVLASGQGTTAEYALDYILEKNGLVPGTDVNVEFASEHAEVVTKAVQGGYEVILLPEPFVTQMKLQNAGFETVIDLTKEWEKLGGGLLTMGAVAVRKEFAEQHPEAVAAFLKDYEASVNYVNGNIDDASALIEKYDIAKAAVAKQAIPNCNITFMTGDEMKKNVSEYLSVLAGYNPAAAGGELPGDDFYYTVSAK